MSEMNGARMADDLAQLDVSKATFTMEVVNLRKQVMRHEDGRPFTITIFSKDHPAWEETVQRLAEERNERERGREPPSISEQRRIKCEVLAALTTSWDIILSGQKAPNNREAYFDAYWQLQDLMEQVDRSAEARVNFTKS
jgi:hypothetical protein